MKRVIILMMDSFGIGGAKDAYVFGDEGANTLYNISVANGGLEVPNLNALGLGKVAALSTGKTPNIKGKASIDILSRYGVMQEISKGKDTSSGHWEMAGVPVLFDWGYFPKDYPSFNNELIDSIMKESGIKGVLGNIAASGTAIIEEFGEEHIKTLKPIFYTSADSVMQIAAHEKYFGLDDLYKLCEIAFEKVKPYNIARVIARPFVGEKKGEFIRTKNRHDYSVTPPAPTVLDKLKQNGGEVVSVGKISDIFAGSGITKAVKASGLKELWDVTLNEVKIAKDNTIVFTNFVDFDMLWGHRRDVKGYAQGLEYFDKRIPELIELLQDDDIVFITADHGCDPTYKGTDHTRENVPVIIFGKKIITGELGVRKTYSDIGQTIAAIFNLKPMNYGNNLL